MLVKELFEDHRSDQIESITQLIKDIDSCILRLQYEHAPYFGVETIGPMQKAIAGLVAKKEELARKK